MLISIAYIFSFSFFKSIFMGSDYDTRTDGTNLIEQRSSLVCNKGANWTVGLLEPLQL